ncbi:MAG: hypothetical protein JW919_03110 [Candidatus Omnitrophica bacterium]|nr:hypothetical protein [Candidatus Omnitrophota bacterium]
MKKDRFFVWLVAILIIAASFCVFTERALQAQGSADPEVVKKLNEILANQRTIMADLANMKVQLQEIKVRATP